MDRGTGARDPFAEALNRHAHEAAGMAPPLNYTGAMTPETTTDYAEVASPTQARAARHPDAPITIGPIGSRGALLTCWFVAEQPPGAPLSGGPYVVTGCFRGSLDAFAHAVEGTHGDGPFGQEYRSAIAFLRSLALKRGAR